MAKSKEFRELQISSGQLAAVIFALLALCVFIFYLGTRIGAKKALFAAGGPAEARTEKVIEPKPAVSDPAKPSPQSSAGGPGALKTEAGREKAKPPAETMPAVENKAAPVETKPPVDDKIKPAEKKSGAETKVKTADTKTAGEAKPKPAAGIYFVQAAAVDSRTAAETFAKNLEKLGYRTVVLDPLERDQRIVYRVRIGPYETKAEAEAARTKLASDLKKRVTDFFVVRAGA